jgi:nucleoid DNA-binding protein
MLRDDLNLCGTFQAQVIVKSVINALVAAVNEKKSVKIYGFGKFRLTKIGSKTHFSGFSKEPKVLPNRAKIKWDNSPSMIEYLSRSNK